MREQARVHEHRRRTQRIAERARARPFEHRVGEKENSPAAAHPMVERDQVLGRLRERMRHQEQAALCQLGRVGDADRDHAIARLKRFQAPASRRPAARSLRRTRAAGWSRGAAAGAARPAAAATACGRRSCGRTRARRLRRKRRQSQISTRRRARGHFLFAVTLLLACSDAPGATPSSASGSLGSLAAACCTACWSRLARPGDDRAQQHQKEGESQAGQPNADALRAASGLVGHRNRRSYVPVRQYASTRP